MEDGIRLEEAHLEQVNLSRDQGLRTCGDQPRQPRFWR